MNTRLIDSRNTSEWQSVGELSIGRSIRKGRKYRHAPARFYYQSIGKTGGTIRPGDYCHVSTNTDAYIAQYVGHVTADRDGDVPAFKGLAVLALSLHSGGIFERWIDRADIGHLIGPASLRLFVS